MALIISNINQSTDNDIQYCDLFTMKTEKGLH